MSEAQYQLRNAQSQLSASRSRLTRLEASLRALSSGYAQLQSGFAAEIGKLETAAAKVNALSGNRYGGNLESLKKSAAVSVGGDAENEPVLCRENPPDWKRFGWWFGRRDGYRLSESKNLERRAYPLEAFAAVQPAEW